MIAAADDGGMDRLIDELRDPACYPHPVDRVEVVETHISWVLLAGGCAYKVKKPVCLPFLDFGTLAARRHFCEEELRLNRRTAPELYLEVVPIARTAAGGVAISALGEPVEYAVKMRRFASGCLADERARGGTLGAAQIDRLAGVLAQFHAAAPRADVAGPFGAPERVEAAAIGNFEQIAALECAPRADSAAAARFARLRSWTLNECLRLRPVFERRRGQGFVRECHGDLHLGNIAFIDGHAVPFDCIEFDPALRWIDVMSEIAFVVMDLLAHRLPGPAWRLLNACLEASGDYEGIGVLRFYLVYRAMVRAKVALLRGSQDAFGAHLDLAESLAHALRPALVLMHGLSGSGKTTVSQAMLEPLGAVRVRSDIERKRLHGLAPKTRTSPGLRAGIYDADATARTYDRLIHLARVILDAGYPAIVDAAFLRRAERDRFKRLAQDSGGTFLVAACTAPEETLLERLARREAQGSDASDAGLAVLEHQLAAWQPLAADELKSAVPVDAGSDAALDAVVRRFGKAFD